MVGLRQVDKYETIKVFSLGGVVFLFKSRDRDGHTVTVGPKNWLNLNSDGDKKWRHIIN